MAGWGFTVMSGWIHGVTPVLGKCYLPDKEFRWICYLDQPILGWRAMLSRGLLTSP
jgi:hypothetical protein